MPITDLRQLDFDKTYTYADYLHWKVKERLELLRGKIALMSPAPSMRHQRVSRKLFLEIGKYLEHHKCELFSAPFDVRLVRKNQQNPDETIYTVVQPDLCVICDPAKLDERGCLGAPELVIEILSPGNTHREMREKFELYEEAGVEEYWIVDPMSNSMLVYVSNAEGQFIGKRPLTTEDVLTSTLLPGLEIDVAEVLLHEG